MHIPDVETMIIVHHRNSSILFIIGHGTGVRILRVVGVGGHVGNGKPLGHVHAQVVRPRQRRHELQRVGREAAYNPLRTPDKHKFFSHRETIGTET